MVRVQQPRASGHDPVPIEVGIVAEGDVVPILQADQARHGVRRRAVHADLAVLVHGHEAERGIDIRVDDLDLQAVLLNDRSPVAHARAAHRIGPDLQSGGLDGVDIDDAAQVVHVGRHEVVLVVIGECERLCVGDPHDFLQAVPQQRVGPVLHGFGRARVGGAALGRVVFEAAVRRGIVRRRDHDAVGERFGPATVVGQDGVRDRRRGRVAAALLHEDVHAVRGEHLDRGPLRRLGQRVGVHAQVERPGRARVAPVLDERLADRGDVVFVERSVGGCSAMPGRPERHGLRRNFGIRLDRIVAGDQARNVDEQFRRRGLAGESVDGHRFFPWCECGGDIKGLRRSRIALIIARGEVRMACGLPPSAGHLFGAGCPACAFLPELFRGDRIAIVRRIGGGAVE